MFGGLKKKLQEAIAKVTAPKKDEIVQEIRKDEEEHQQQEIKQEIQELQSKEKETREVMEGRRIDDTEHKIQRMEERMEAKVQKEEMMLEKLEEEITEEKEDDLEEMAREEFDKIARQESADKEDEAELLARQQLLEKAGIKAAPEEQKLLEKKELAAESKLRELLETEKPDKKKEEKRSFISKIVKKIAEKTLDEKEIGAIIKNLELALLENDTALEVAEKICGDVKKGLVGKSVKRGDVENVVNESLRHAMLDVMKQEKIDIETMIREKEGPLLIMFLGFNGTGKTTSLSKIAYRLKKYKPVIAAGDTFRAASIEQLEEHGKRLDIEVVKHKYGSDSAAVIFDSKNHAKAIGSKLVLADTAGRSHSNVNLMDELKKVVRVNKPDLKILVLDSVTGNDIYEQARLFNEAVGVDGIILTKADVYDKGGAALSAAYTLKKPIMYLGVGQEYNDLKEFVPEEVVENLLE